MTRFRFALNGLGALQSALLIIGLLATAGISAEPIETELFHMLVISNEHEGKALLEGRHAETIEALTRSRVRVNRFSASNNLCVAYVRTKQADKALAACKKAVDRSRLATRRNQAIALSNLGVVRALTGDIDGARHAFRAAIRLNAELGAPTENLARLQIRVERAVASL